MKTTTRVVCGLLTLATALQVSAKPAQTLAVTLPQPIGGIEVIRERVCYPEFPRDMCWESDVILRFRVSDTGTISNIQVVKSGGDAFDRAAIESLQGTHWIPATQEDQNIPCIFQLPFRFCLP